jgi:hypothetical protein
VYQNRGNITTKVQVISLYNGFITATTDLDSLRGHVEALCISNAAQWDVLAFVYSHGTNLASAEHLGRLLGYDKATAGAALDSLTSSGLIQRSRHSRGLRLYQVADLPENDPRRFSLHELMKLTNDRKGRLQMTGYFRLIAPHTDRRENRGLHLA